MTEEDAEEDAKKGAKVPIDSYVKRERAHTLVELAHSTRHIPGYDPERVGRLFDKIGRAFKLSREVFQRCAEEGFNKIEEDQVVDFPSKQAIFQRAFSLYDR